MTKTNNTFKAPPLPKGFYATIIIVILLIVFFFLYATGWMAYTKAFIECGLKRPVYAYSTSGIAGARVELLYALPGESEYQIANEFNPFSTHNYYCSEDKARVNGYSHNKF